MSRPIWSRFVDVILQSSAIIRASQFPCLQIYTKEEEIGLIILDTTLDSPSLPSDHLLFRQIRR